jgi:hypothetical protein
MPYQGLMGILVYLGYHFKIMVLELNFELEMLVHTCNILKVGPIIGFMKTSNT